MGEQDLKDTLKRSEFKNIIATILSTITIVLSFVYGFKEFVTELKQDISIEIKAEVRNGISDYNQIQTKKDAEQDFKINKIIYRENQ